MARDNPFTITTTAPISKIMEVLPQPIQKDTSASKLSLLCGLPCSGKSTWVQKQLASLENIVLCPDDFRLILTGQEFYAPAEDSVWSHVKTAARVLLKSHSNRTVIIDATHLTVGSRSQWIRMSKERQVSIDCIWFDVSLDECMRRMQHRERKIPHDVMLRMATDFVPPTVAEGFENIVKV